MIPLSAELQTALDQRLVIPRDFIWFEVINRDTGNPYAEGYWSGIETVNATVRDTFLGSVVSRDFFGVGSLIGIDGIVRTANLTISETNIYLSSIENRVQDLVRGYEPKFGKIQIFRGLLSTTTGLLIDHAFPRFAGIINNVEIKRPTPGGVGQVIVSCVSVSQEMTRSNPLVRDTASQKQRLQTDTFFNDVATVGDVEFFWGAKNSG